MVKLKPWKIGVGTGAILFGLYLAFNQKNFIATVVGFILIATGISLIASN